MAECKVDQAVIDALNAMPPTGLEYFYSKWRKTSNATPAFIAEELELFRAKVGDVDQGFGPAALNYAQTNMTLQGKLPRRALLRELGIRYYFDLMPNDRVAQATFRMNTDLAVKRAGDDYTRLTVPEAFLAGPDLASSYAVLQQAAPAATPQEFRANYSTAGCGARPLSQPILLEENTVFSVCINQRVAVPALAAGQVFDVYAVIGVQWL